MASLCLISIPSWKSVGRKQTRNTSVRCANNNNNNNKCEANSFFLSPSDERILKQAFKEPVAFMGGMFAGVLRLDLNEDPLKEWVKRTVETSGITTNDEEDEQQLDTQPQEIEIQ
ncbi:hypothetical protein M8C21_032827 [Ambrosia artemisiifolia]|uniref:Uncharacterized protein n=1 Tax=Ambrosia artemisiifolia TaxID=4212 RepID=A0AAD5GUP0_AMBAR|nr:hypothetical protein M8C21_032827 [Ambrosia artemisiifolia]